MTTPRVASCVVIVFLIINAIPFAVYGTASALDLVQPPEEEVAGRFFLGVLVEKVAHAVAFVSLFALTRSVVREKWLHYAFIWWLLFVLGEAGVAIRGEFTWPEAFAGMIAETIYLPASAAVTRRLVGGHPTAI